MWAARGSKVRHLPSTAPQKHPQKRARQREKRGWFTGDKAAGRLGQLSADNALASSTQSLVLKGGSCCHLQIEA